MYLRTPKRGRTAGGTGFTVTLDEEWKKWARRDVESLVHLRCLRETGAARSGAAFGRNASVSEAGGLGKDTRPCLNAHEETDPGGLNKARAGGGDGREGNAQDPSTHSGA